MPLPKLTVVDRPLTWVGPRRANCNDVATVRRDGVAHRYVCTGPHNHGGDHVAELLGRTVAVWPRKEAT